MLKNHKKSNLKINYKGQSMIEYILAFVAVVVFLIVAVGPGGIFSNKIEESLGNAVLGAKCMTTAICYASSCPTPPSICP